MESGAADRGTRVSGFSGLGDDQNHGTAIKIEKTCFENARNIQASLFYTFSYEI